LRGLFAGVQTGSFLVIGAYPAKAGGAGKWEEGRVHRPSAELTTKLGSMARQISKYIWFILQKKRTIGLPRTFLLRGGIVLYWR
jgi:hypothetical protein